MIPLFKPHMPDLPEIEKIFKSGKLAAGKYTQKFTQILIEFFNNSNICTFNNSTLAIYSTLEAMGISSGDEVIMSPLACLVSAQPYLTYGLNIVWADIDAKTGTLSPTSVANKITENTKLIVHNHFCGYPGHIEDINKIAHDNNILVIDDGIECFASQYKSKLIGSLDSDATIFSTKAVRIPNTIDGSFTIFKSSHHYKKCTFISDCGIDRSIFRNKIGEINDLCDISLNGYDAKMNNINSYIGIKQMEHIDEILKKQRENGAKLESAFAQAKIDTLSSNNGLANYWVFGFFCKEKNRTIEKLKNNDIYASGVHYDLSKYSSFPNSEKLLGVESFMNKFIAIPSGWWVDITDEYINKLRRII